MVGHHIYLKENQNQLHYLDQADHDTYVLESETNRRAQRGVYQVQMRMAFPLIVHCYQI